MDPKFAERSPEMLPLHVLEAEALEEWLAEHDGPVANWVRANGFTAALGSALVVPGADGKPAMALAGYGTPQTRARGRFHLAAAAASLPKGRYGIVPGILQGAVLEQEMLGWLFAQYEFGRYRAQSGIKARLVCEDQALATRLEIIAAGEFLTRDLINTPASDMGPEALELACRDLAEQHGAKIQVIHGAALLEENFPMIHAVGRASAQAPRLIDLRYGDAGPTVTLVGKGVCFDTGGLNLKPGASMGLMKKDMGGAATVLGLAHMIMALDLPLQLRVLIPAVENAVSANAMRPGDILIARNGMSVEINNTDAEGRLVLADALSYGAEEDPDLMISMATLTGAARVALGPDLAPYYSDDPAVVSGLETGATKVADPVWRMPFWAPYEKDIEPGIADLDNAPKGGFAGSITAALFLRRFAGNEARYTHFDIYGWCPAPRPGRPKGGVGMGARALLEALPDILDQ